MWRLGRQVDYFELVLQTRTRSWSKSGSSGEMHQPQVLVFLTHRKFSTKLTKTCSSLCGITAADGEPASVTDEEPVYNPTGLCDPVD